LTPDDRFIQKDWDRELKEAKEYARRSMIVTINKDKEEDQKDLITPEDRVRMLHILWTKDRTDIEYRVAECEAYCNLFSEHQYYFTYFSTWIIKSSACARRCLVSEHGRKH
jgi:hypothetical protein